MPGRGRLEAFVSGRLFWLYLALGNSRKKRDMTSVCSLNIRVGVLMSVKCSVMLVERKE